jgi:hypothetical protein
VLTGKDRLEKGMLVGWRHGEWILADPRRDGDSIPPKDHEILRR